MLMRSIRTELSYDRQPGRACTEGLGAACSERRQEGPPAVAGRRAGTSPSIVPPRRSRRLQRRELGSPDCLTSARAASLRPAWSLPLSGWSWGRSGFHGAEPPRRHIIDALRSTPDVLSSSSPSLLPEPGWDRSSGAARMESTVGVAMLAANSRPHACSGARQGKAGTFALEGYQKRSRGEEARVKCADRA